MSLPGYKGQRALAVFVRSVALSWVKEKHGIEEMGMATRMGTGRQQQLQGKRMYPAQLLTQLQSCSLSHPVHMPLSINTARKVSSFQRAKK